MSFSSGIRHARIRSKNNILDDTAIANKIVEIRDNYASCKRCQIDMSITVMYNNA